MSNWIRRQLVSSIGWSDHEVINQLNSGVQRLSLEKEVVDYNGRAKLKKFTFIHIGKASPTVCTISTLNDDYIVLIEER